MNVDIGVVDLVIDLFNFRIFYVSMWYYGRRLWFIKLGGEGGGFYKLIDGGESWDKLEKGLFMFIGKVGVDIVVFNLKCLYVIVEVEEGGVYCSDDVGKLWLLMNGDNIFKVCVWYYNYIKVDLNDENIFYVMNV